MLTSTPCAVGFLATTGTANRIPSKLWLLIAALALCAAGEVILDLSHIHGDASFETALRILVLALVAAVAGSAGYVNGKGSGGN